jgi:hypothetical protein
MKKNKKLPANHFKSAVEKTPDVSNAYCIGLQAFKKVEKQKIDLGDPPRCEGSIDIDTATRKKYPQANRWDYCFSYKGEVFFVEVHSANTGEVSTVLRKLQWLRNWLNNEAPLINALKATSVPAFYWIQSSSFNILPNSAQYRQAVQANLKPVGKLSLP